MFYYYTSCSDNEDSTKCYNPDKTDDLVLDWIDILPQAVDNSLIITQKRRFVQSVRYFLDLFHESKYYNEPKDVKVKLFKYIFTNILLTACGEYFIGTPEHHTFKLTVLRILDHNKEFVSEYEEWHNRISNMQF